ncbi:hypothetical protein VTI74DRAFT_7147 [Chaetomium olivicolor]
MKMRLVWYAGGSAALAGAVVASAFYQRSNFYSAMVHLAQSNFSLMVLVNLMFVIYSSFMYGVQRLCFGPLRPTEIEQLYEKAWFAVTETCLAMTIFREEVGAFFLVMFTALVTGKVWGWIGEGRVEILEQQPPANPRLFHMRLGISLFVSIAYDLWLLAYAVNMVVQQARPTMMVMFLFEFAVLAVCSLHTASRYIISLVEQHVIKTQTRQRLEDRRRRVREQREEILRRREAGEATEDDDEELPDENDVDEMDIEVPGWEAKGQWVLSLDLLADFVKLGIYSAFFFVLLTFYGLPIHIMRDWFMTTRSFLKRLHALIRYRQALKHMEQYPDATAEELGREDTCIICREEMRPWDPSDITLVERSRAKKLPCGHILHFGCLKSWLERQQVCPTCRRPVAREGPQPAANGQAVMFRLGLNFPAGQNQQAQQPANGQAPAPGQAAPQGGADDQANVQNRNVRMFNLGPLRLGFAQGGVDEIREMAQRLRAPDVANPPAPTPTTPVPQENNNDIDANLDQLRTQLSTLVQQVRQEMAHVHSVSHELQLLTLYMNELTRLRQARQQIINQQQATQQPGTAAGAQAPLPQAADSTSLPLAPQFGQAPNLHGAHPPLFPQPALFPHLAARPGTVITRHVAPAYGAAIPAGSPDLPEGVVIPQGWSLLPLQRMDGEAQPSDTAAHHTQASHQDMFRSFFPRAPSNPRSRGTSPAPGTGLSAQRGGSTTQPPSTTTVTTINATEPPRAPNPTNPTLADLAAAQYRQPTVTAPTPRAPIWGGQAQLFAGADRGTSMFGYQVDRHPAPGPQPPPEAHREASSSSNGAMGRSPSLEAAGVNGVAPSGVQGNGSANGAAGRSAGGDGDPGPTNGPRVVTVEEADDDEEAQQ